MNKLSLITGLVVISGAGLVISLSKPDFTPQTPVFPIVEEQSVSHTEAPLVANSAPTGPTAFQGQVITVPLTEAEQDTAIDNNTLKNIEQDGKLGELDGRVTNIETKDWCSNIEGVQSVVPAGYSWNQGVCSVYVAPAPEPTPEPIVVQPVPEKLNPIQSRKFFFTGSDAFGTINDTPFIHLEGLKTGVTATIQVGGFTYTLNADNRFIMRDIVRNTTGNTASYPYVINFQYQSPDGPITGTHSGVFSY